MKRSLIQRSNVSPIWIVLGIALLVVAGILLVLAFLNPGAASPSTPTEASANPDAAGTSTVVPSPTASPEPAAQQEPLAATVNGVTITQSYLSQTVRLNQVLGRLSGASTLDERETLQRLIRSELILQGAEDIDEPTAEEVESFIDSLQRNWGVSDEMVVERLEAVGLERGFLEDTIERLLTVQAGVESLEEEGHNISEWLRERQDDADIMVFEDLASAETSPTVAPTRTLESATRTVPPSTPTQEPDAAMPAVASDFTLDRAGGGTFSLSSQLEKGPVVLVFFERCG